MVAPEAACRNLERLAADGQQGAYGFYEAVDYTPSRLPPGADERHRASVHGAPSRDEPAVAGLSCCSTSPMQRRFQADPMLRAADLLLQERVPKATAPVFPHASEASATRSRFGRRSRRTMRVFTDPERRDARRSICSPTAATTSSSPAPAAATAAGAIWP